MSCIALSIRCGWFGSIQNTSESTCTELWLAHLLLYALNPNRFWAHEGVHASVAKVGSLNPGSVLQSIQAANSGDCVFLFSSIFMLRNVVNVIRVIFHLPNVGSWWDYHASFPTMGRTRISCFSLHIIPHPFHMSKECNKENTLSCYQVSVALARKRHFVTNSGNSHNFGEMADSEYPNDIC